MIQPPLWGQAGVGETQKIRQRQCVSARVGETWHSQKKMSQGLPFPPVTDQYGVWVGVGQWLSTLELFRKNKVPHIWEESLNSRLWCETRWRPQQSLWFLGTSVRSRYMWGLLHTQHRCNRSSLSDPSEKTEEHLGVIHYGTVTRLNLDHLKPIDVFTNSACLLINQQWSSCQKIILQFIGHQATTFMPH